MTVAACGAPIATSAPAARTPPPDHVRVNERYELTIDAAIEANDVEVRVTAPSGAELVSGAFRSRGRLALRFTPREPGLHRWTVHGPHGLLERGAVEAVASGRRGFVHVDPTHGTRLVSEDGATTFLVGESRLDLLAGTSARDVREKLEQASARGATTLRVSAGALDERGAEALDALFDAAEATDTDIVLLAFDRPSQRSFFVAGPQRRDAIARLRAIADRWGSSPRLVAVDLLDEPERDGVDEAAWIPWAVDLARAWRSFDPYGHLVTAGPVGLQWNVVDDERPWYESGANDLVQWHLFGPEVREPHEVARAVAMMVDETAALTKPVLCGALAAVDAEQAHVGAWSLALSGAGALVRGPAAPDLRVLSRTLRSLDPRSAYAPTHDVRVVRPDGARAWSVGTVDKGDRLVWLLAPREGYGERVGDAALTINAPRGGRYRVRWIDDVTGEPIALETITSSDEDVLVLHAPAYARHVLARVTHQP